MTNQQRHRLVDEFASVVGTDQQRELEKKKVQTTESLL